MSQGLNFTSVADGFCFLEAPRTDGACVWFSEVLVGGLRRWSPSDGITTWLPERKWIGGMAINQDGAVLCSGPGGIVWFDPKSGATGVLLDQIDGQALSGVNDMQPDGKGGLFFGTIDFGMFQGASDIQPSAIFHLDRHGIVRCLTDDVSATNGMGFSPDGATFYHNESMVGTFAYTVNADGGLSDKRLLLAKPDCDGLVVDSRGGLWVAGYETPAIICLSAQGDVERTIGVPAAGVTSLCFGGDDLRDLYVTTPAQDVGVYFADGTLPTPTAALYHARADVAGQPAYRTGFTLGLT